MKKYITGILFLALILALSSCNNVTTTTDIKNLELAEVKDLSVLSADIKEQITKLSKARGYYLLENGDNEALILISLGEKSTGGYNIINQKANIENGQMLITFEEIEPDEVATQVITYPYKVYKLNSSIEDSSKLIVKNASGEQFKPIDIEGIEENGLSFVKGEYVGQIDGNSIEIIIDNQPKAFQLGETAELFNSLDLDNGQQIEITYEENEHEQLILKEIRINKETVEKQLIVQGKYIGQIDPHSIEIEINNEVKAFQITEVIDVFNQLNLQEGDMVIITYIGNEIISIKKLKD